MTINDEILILANIIANAGHKPTVALVKTKLTKSVPLPVIISTLRNWQHQPDFIALPDKVNDKKVKPISEVADSSLDSLKEELKQIKKDVVELKQLVHELTKQNKQKNIR